MGDFSRAGLVLGTAAARASSDLTGSDFAFFVDVGRQELALFGPSERLEEKFDTGILPQQDCWGTPGGNWTCRPPLCEVSECGVSAGAVWQVGSTLVLTCCGVSTAGGCRAVAALITIVNIADSAAENDIGNGATECQQRNFYRDLTLETFGATVGIGGSFFRQILKRTDDVALGTIDGVLGTSNYTGNTISNTSAIVGDACAP